LTNGIGGINRRLRYIVIGAGMSGILAAIRLKQAGCDDFIVYEKRSKLGGTWLDNRYPGLTCDVPAHAYTYSFAPNPEWSAYFAPGPEIREYFEAMADRYALRASIQMDSEVVRCAFSDADGRWHLTLQDGSTDVGDVVIAATGVLHHPYIPKIPGMEDFDGPVFHSARWDENAVTANRRIGIIGTGSTGIQIVGALQPAVARLVHFARTPQWIVHRQNFPYSYEDRHAFRGDIAAIDAVRYGFEYQSFLKRWYTAVTSPDLPEFREIQDFVSKNLEASVRDPKLKEKLRPNYLPLCKRLVISWNYYEAVQQPNVEVETGAIERVEKNGIRMQDGTFHQLDIIVLATGFKADRFIRPTVVNGRGGIELDKAWDRRPVAYYAISVPDFPNFFLLNGPTAPVGNFSLIDVAELQWDYIEQLLHKIRGGECNHISAKHQALERYEERRVAAAKGTVFGTGCKSWYLDTDGIPAGWPWNYDIFIDAMKRPVLEDYELR
jgi:cation diffusion facilitator CzcD-associated flavoprotein CzcO